MCPNACIRGRILSFTSLKRSEHPQKHPSLLRSRIPLGGVCVTNTSTSEGIKLHLSLNACPRGRPNAPPRYSGCHGLPYIITLLSVCDVMSESVRPVFACILETTYEESCR